MKPAPLLSVAAVLASLGLAACGGSSGGSPRPAASSSTVALKSVDGVGTLLVDSSGRALYASDLEAGGKVMCTGPCESFWKPLLVPSGPPTGASGVGRLSVIERPGGGRQVAIEGKPLYTFVDDRAGQPKGIGFKDAFGGRHFTWNAVLAGGGLATRSSAGATGGGYSGGGYG
jgi:predicted lipoprotein with Yx(FWY)xxD motif